MRTRCSLPRDLRVHAYRGSLLFSILFVGWLVWDGLSKWGEPCAEPQAPLLASVPSLLLYMIAMVQSRYARNKAELRMSLVMIMTWSFLTGLAGLVWAMRGMGDPLLPAAWSAGQAAIIVTATTCLPLIAEDRGRGLSVAGGIAVAVIMAVLVVQISTPALVRSRLGANEANAVGSVRLIINCAVTYRYTHPEEGFPNDIALMGPEQDGCLQETILAASTWPEGADASGYRFRYTGGEESEKQVAEFTVSAVPALWGRTGCRAFFGDETGVVRFTREHRSATKDDPAY